MELTKEQTIKVLDHCMKHDLCSDCPLNHVENCCEIARENAIRYLKENEPAPAVTGTSSKVKTLQIDDSTLLEICQEGLLEISNRIAEVNDGDDYILGYAHAILDVIGKLKAGEGNESN